MMRGLLTTPSDKEKLSREDKGQINELISNIGLISNNIVRIFDVLRETNFVKIQELIETIHQMFVRQQLCDENMDYDHNIFDIRASKNINRDLNVVSIDRLNPNNIYCKNFENTLGSVSINTQNGTVEQQTTCHLKDVNEQECEDEIFHDQINYDNCIDNLEIEDTVSPINNNNNNFKHGYDHANDLHNNIKNKNIQILHSNINKDALSPNTIENDNIHEEQSEFNSGEKLQISFAEENIEIGDVNCN